jgi:hypothetical protein
VAPATTNVTPVTASRTEKSAAHPIAHNTGPENAMSTTGPVAVALMMCAVGVAEVRFVISTAENAAMGLPVASVTVPGT